MKRLGKTKRTNRGFRIVEFKDLSGVACSLQASSLAIYTTPGISAVWLGCDDANPQIEANKASAAGVKTDVTAGWVPYPIPEEVLLNTRMHLTREQVSALVNHLVSWLERGTFQVR